MTHPEIQQAVLDCRGRMSQREISVRFHISRATVGSILSRGYVKYFSNKHVGNVECNEQSNPQKENEIKVEWTGVVGRCPECGRLVHLPCLACKIEEISRRKQGLLV